MTDKQWVVLEEAIGEVQAEILRGALEAQGIPVVLSHEAVGRVFPVAYGPMARVQILVASENLKRAQKILKSYNAGESAEQAAL